MANDHKDWKARLSQILDKHRQRHNNPEIVSWVGKELHPAFNTLKKLLEDERGVAQVSVTKITSSGETLEFEVGYVFTSACIRYAVNLTDSKKDVTAGIELTVNGNELYKPETKNILHWRQDEIINDFLTALEKWNG